VLNVPHPWRAGNRISIEHVLQAITRARNPGPEDSPGRALKWLLHGTCGGDLQWSE
jgi:hypothetical protein